MKPFPCKNHKIVIIFLLLLNYYRDVIENIKSHHYIHDVLIQVVEKYISSEQYLIFIDSNNTFGDILRIYNFRN